MKYYCNEEGVRILRQLSSGIEAAVEEIKTLTDSVRAVANDNSDVLGPHVNSLHEALDDIKTSLYNSTNPVSDIAVRLGNVADGYKRVIDDDPFGDSPVGGGINGASASGAVRGTAESSAAGIASGAAGNTGSEGSGLIGSSTPMGADQALMQPVAGAIPRSLSHTQYGYSIDSNLDSVYDSPMEMDRYLYASQGSANKNYRGTCGLCSCANILRLAGVEFGEGDMIEYASQNYLCGVYEDDPDASGGTSPYSRKKILEHFGVRSEIVDVPMAYDGGTPEAVKMIGKYVGEGRGVILSVHAGILDPAAYNVNGFGDDYHAVTVTSVKRNGMGEPIGFYICDSNQGTKYYSADIVRRSLTGNGMNVTSQIIR